MSRFPVPRPDALLAMMERGKSYSAYDLGVSARYMESLEDQGRVRLEQTPRVESWSARRSLRWVKV